MIPTNDDELHGLLQRAGYICSRELAVKVWAAIHTRPAAGAFLKGPAGSGKTLLPDVLGKVLDIPSERRFFIQCFTDTRIINLLHELVVDDNPNNASGIRKHENAVLRAARASTEGKTILTIDEWDKTRPSADSFLLDFLQSGRIDYGGVEVKADLDNIIVMVTMNDERDLSEHLMRRLPIIEFDRLPARLVREALYLTHYGHPDLESAITIYKKWRKSGITKPCTIQELRQLLDAFTVAGPSADFDTLVFQYVTKTKENHDLLAHAPDANDPEDSDNASTLDPEQFNSSEKGEGKIKLFSPRMPSIRGTKFPTMVKGKGAFDAASSYGAVQMSASSYDSVLNWMNGDLNADPADLGVATVTTEGLSLTRPIPIEHYERVFQLGDVAGEVMLHAPMMGYDDIMALRSRGLQVTSHSRDEVVAVYEHLDFHWTPQTGVEIIVQIKHRNDLKFLLGALEVEAVEGGWLNAPLIDDPQYWTLKGEADRYGLVHRRLRGIEPKPLVIKMELDNFGRPGFDKVDDANIPVMDALCTLVEKKGRILRVMDNRYFIFDNCLIGLLLKSNDIFQFYATGPIPDGLGDVLSYFAPAYGIAVGLAFTTSVDENVLIKNHGFRLVRQDTQMSRLERGDMVVTYSNGVIAVGRTVPSHSITTKAVNEAIRQTVDARGELSY